KWCSARQNYIPNRAYCIRDLGYPIAIELEIPLFQGTLFHLSFDKGKNKPVQIRLFLWGFLISLLLKGAGR
ncbi:hypothetical protein KA005_20250, partial [bacterium]|nr:hypothetical protein [bacterium]